MNELTPEPKSEIARPEVVARAALVVGLVGIGAFSVAYRLLVLAAAEQTAAMFIGLPTLLAVLTVMFARPKTALGTAIAVTTVSLLASAIVFYEGFICILMAAPLFYGVAIGVAVAWDALRGSRGGPRAFAATLLPLFVMSLEGVWIDLPRENTVTASAVVAASPEAVREALAGPVDLDHPLPAGLKLGFPVPVEASGTGLLPGDLRTIHFAGGEGKPGDMVFKVVGNAPNRVQFELVSDSSHIAHWLRWNRSDVRLTEVPGGTRVDWTAHYRRDLDPAWYFDPFERLAMRAAAGWLIEAAATP